MFCLTSVQLSDDILTYMLLRTVTEHGVHIPDKARLMCVNMELFKI